MFQQEYKKDQKLRYGDHNPTNFQREERDNMMMDKVDRLESILMQLLNKPSTVTKEAQHVKVAEPVVNEDVSIEESFVEFI